MDFCSSVLHGSPRSIQFTHVSLWLPTYGPHDQSLQYTQLVPAGLYGSSDSVFCWLAIAVAKTVSVFNVSVMFSLVCMFLLISQSCETINILEDDMCLWMTKTPASSQRVSSSILSLPLPPCPFLSPPDQITSSSFGSHLPSSSSYATGDYLTCTINVLHQLQSFELSPFKLSSGQQSDCDLVLFLFIQFISSELC